MKPVLFYLAIVFIVTASCPDIRKNNIIGDAEEKNTIPEAPVKKIVKSACEDKIKAIPPITGRFNGIAAQPVFETSTRLYDPETDTYPVNYRTKIKEAVAAGVNFAGKYIVGEWGVGTGSQGHAIINAETGRIIAYGLRSNEGVDFSISSPVLVINPKKNFIKFPGRDEAKAYSSQFRRDYYKVENDSLVLICSEVANVGW